MTGGLLDKVKQAFHQHRTAFLAVGGAGVAGVALVMSHRKGGGAASPTDPQPAGAVGAGQDPYSSVAYDVYDALEPQLEGLQAQIAALQSKPGSGKGKKTKPKPKPRPPRGHKKPKPSPRHHPDPRDHHRAPGQQHHQPKKHGAGGGGGLHRPSGVKLYTGGSPGGPPLVGVKLYPGGGSSPGGPPRVHKKAAPVKPRRKAGR